MPHDDHTCDVCEQHAIRKQNRLIKYAATAALTGIIYLMPIPVVAFIATATIIVFLRWGTIR